MIDQDNGTVNTRGDSGAAKRSGSAESTSAAGQSMGNKGFIPALRFHALTRLYDPVVRVTTRERAIKQRLVAGLGTTPRSILDIGSGTGTLLAMLRARYPQARLVGLDADVRIIELARAKLGNDIEIVQGNATAPGFLPRSFDRVVSSLVFHHLNREQKLAALRAIRELLTDDGEFHLADWGAPHGLGMRLAFLGVQFLDGFETTRDHIEGHMPELFREAGFEVRRTWRQRTPLGSMSINIGVPR